MYPDLQYAVVLAVVLDEYSVSNGSVCKLEELLVVDQRWEGSTGHSKDMDPTCKHVAAVIGNVLKQVRSISFAD